MNKVLAKVDNVYFASKWFSNRHGELREGAATVSDSKVFARRYDSIDVVERDAKLLGISLDRVTFERVA